MNTKELLVAARLLIEKPEHWTQGLFARDSEGYSAPSRSPEAVCFCAMGAVMRASGDDPELEYEGIHLLAQALGKQGLASFNDNRCHEEVLSLFDRAIANA